MTISSVSGLSSLQAVNAAQGAQRPDQAANATEAKGPGFGERIGNAIQQVAEAQQNAAKSAADFEMGKTDDLASVMIDQQVSSLGFQMTLQVRNKALTAYRDIMNMPL